MSQVHGKQIKDESVLLSKINPATGQTLTLVGTSKIQQSQAPSLGDDLANKSYVDSIASGLDPKQAVNLATITSITATYSHGGGGGGVGSYLYGTGALSVDGVTISTGERILIKNQTPDSQNGIYDVGTAGTNWVLTRTLDFDGTPTNEVNGGEFTFVMSGDTLSDTGWVVSSPSGVDAIIGTTSIQWVQFSSAGTIIAGSGLEQSGNVINFQTGDNSLTVGATNAVVNVDGSTIQTGASGLEIVSGGITETQLNQSVAGAGLTGGSGSSLSVQVDNGLSINSDNVELGGTLTKTTTIDGASNELYLNSMGTFSITADAGDITLFRSIGSQTSALKLVNGGGAQMDDIYGATISRYAAHNTFGTQMIYAKSIFAPQSLIFNGFSMTVRDSPNTKGLVYFANYSANFTDRSLVDKEYVDTAIAGVPTGDITGITAGAGLIGGGSSGYVTLDVQANNGLTVASDNVQLGGTLNQNTTININSFTMSFTGGNIQMGPVRKIVSSVANGVGIDFGVTGDTNTGYLYNQNYFNTFYLGDDYLGMYRYLSGVNSYSFFEARNTQTRMAYSVSDTATNSIAMNATSMTITNNAVTARGIEYAADYSSNYTNRSLVDKAYVDGAVGAIPTGDITGVTAGAGLTGGGSSGYVTLDVQANNGLTVASDNVQLGGTLNQNTTINTTGFNLNLDNTNGSGIQISSSSNQTTIISSTGGSNMAEMTVNPTVAYMTYTQGFSIMELSISPSQILVTDDINERGIEYLLDYSANYTNRTLVDKEYVDNAIAGAPTGDVVGVTAGAGLSGGGSSGFLQLDAELTVNGGLTFSGVGDSGTIEVDYSALNSTLSSSLAGDGLVQNGSTIDVNVGDGLAIISDIVEISLVTNSGLTFSTGALDLNLGTGLSISGGGVITNASLSLITDSLPGVGLATGSSIQSALEALDAIAATVEVSENVSLDLSPAPSAVFTSGINVVSSATFSNNSDGDAWVYLNGMSQVVGSSTASAWFFSGDGGTTARTNKDPQIGDQLIVNIDVLGFSISGSNNDDDIIEVKYDAII